MQVIDLYIVSPSKYVCFLLDKVYFSRVGASLGKGDGLSDV